MGGTNCTMIELPLFRLRATLAETIQRVQRGEAVVITRHGKPVAQLLPMRESSWEGLNVIPPETRQRPRIVPFRGTGRMSREVIAERRRRG